MLLCRRLPTLLALALMGVGGGASVALADPTPDPALAALLAAAGREGRDVVRVSAREGGKGAGATRVVALAGQWERPPLLAAELGGRFVTHALPRGASVEWLALRDLTGDGAPEVLARVATVQRRVDHETRVVHLTVWRVESSGFGARPIFQLPERVEEAGDERRSHPTSHLAFEVRFEPARARKGARTYTGAIEMHVTLVRAEIDDEHPLLATPGGHRRPQLWAGRWTFSRYANVFVRDPRSPVPGAKAPPVPGRS